MFIRLVGEGIFQTLTEACLMMIDLPQCFFFNHRNVYVGYKCIQEEII